MKGCSHEAQIHNTAVKLVSEYSEIMKNILIMIYTKLIKHEEYLNHGQYETEKTLRIS
jgi:hypothetical protein